MSLPSVIYLEYMAITAVAPLRAAQSVAKVIQVTVDYRWAYSISTILEKDTAVRTYQPRCKMVIKKIYDTTKVQSPVSADMLYANGSRNAHTKSR